MYTRFMLSLGYDLFKSTLKSCSRHPLSRLQIESTSKVRCTLINPVTQNCFTPVQLSMNFHICVNLESELSFLPQRQEEVCSGGFCLGLKLLWHSIKNSG